MSLKSCTCRISFGRFKHEIPQESRKGSHGTESQLEAAKQRNKFAIWPAIYRSAEGPQAQGPVDGVSNGGGFPDLDLSFFFLSFLGLSRSFRDFPDLSGDCPGVFLIYPFSLSRPINSMYEEKTQKGPRYNPALSIKKGGGIENIESREAILR